MPTEAQSQLSFPENEIREIPLDQIAPDPEQIRKEFRQDEIDALANSIREHGLSQPIQVTESKPGKYKIVDGERRWRAHHVLAKQSGQPVGEATIKAIYVTSDDFERGIIANLLSESYNPMEMADAYSQLKKSLGEDAKDEDVAKKIGKSRSLVTEYNSLLKLPKKIQEQARLNSCVPFNKLKTLAAKKNESDEEKIAEYEKLHKKYAEKRTKNSQQKKESKPQQSRETRSVVAVRKKLETMKGALGDIQLGDKVDMQEKENFLKSLQEIIEAAQAIQQKLPS